MHLVTDGRVKPAFLHVMPPKYARSNSIKVGDRKFDTIQENENEEGLGTFQFKNVQDLKSSQKTIASM